MIKSVYYAPAFVRCHVRTLVGLFAALLAIASSMGYAQGTASSPAAARATPIAGKSASRPRPYPLVASKGFERAVARGSRTRSGVPGPQYWQQRTAYDLRAHLDAPTRRITGSGNLRYINNSPDTLRLLALHVEQNMFRAGAIRNISGPATSGFQLKQLGVGGSPMHAVASTGSDVGYWIAETVLWVRLPAPLLPHDSVSLSAEWSFDLPDRGDIRIGSDDGVFFAAFWYPRFAVYDDVTGWQTDVFATRGEFYLNYGDVDYAVTVPAGWSVAGTGELMNANEILTTEAIHRLQQAMRTDSITHVLSAAELGSRGVTRSTTGEVTWKFRAKNVRDVAWGTSAKWVWDATRAIVRGPGRTSVPDTIAIHSLYRPENAAYAMSARLERHAIEWFSTSVLRYPYPQMSVAEGILGSGGMEYSMITLIGGQTDSLMVFEGTHHETAHMWFPIMVGSDEKRYAWQDEGLAQLLTADALESLWQSDAFGVRSRDRYLAMARTDDERELMRPADEYPSLSRAGSVASYDKSMTVFRMLRTIIGERAFWNGLQSYAATWKFKHPQPYDFFNAFNAASGRNLDWFWRVWFFDRWTLDQSVHSVRQTGNQVRIVVRDKGLAPMPVLLTVTFDNGSTRKVTLPVEPWLAGKTEQSTTIAVNARVIRVEIDPEQLFADVDRSNNTWSAGGDAKRAPS